MPLRTKNIQLIGSKSSDTIITLDQKYNDSFQFNIGNRSFLGSFTDDWQAIARNKRVTVIYNPADNSLLSVNLLTKPKNATVKFAVPDGFEKHNGIGFYVDKTTQSVLDVCNNIVRDGNFSNVALTGGAGYGKTSTAEYFAAKYGLELCIVDCAAMTDNTEWFGQSTAADGNTFFEESEFAKYFEKGNCVILFDEANRFETWIGNTLLPCLDHRKAVTIRNRHFKAGRGIAFFFSTNVGWEYAGTNPMDKALKSRMNGTIHVESLPSNVEEYILQDRYDRVNGNDIRVIVGSMNSLREDQKLKNTMLNFSTRTSLNIAYWMHYGLGIVQAFNLVLTNDANPEDAKLIMDTLKKEINNNA